LNKVLRRYMVGYAVFWDFVLEEADRGGLPARERTGVLRHASMAQASFYDRLVGAVADEYIQELERLARTRVQRHADLVRDVLSGAAVDTAELDYDLRAVHVGVIATGANAGEVLVRWAASAGRRLLSVSQGDDSLWAWLGGDGELCSSELERLVAGQGGDTSLALGEPAQGADGFRLTHRQAQAARIVARRRPEPVVRYADVALLAFGLEDQTMGRSFVKTYLDPVDHGAGSRGPVMRETLRAYFAAGQNAASAAAALGVHERTVSNRLRAMEEALGRPIRMRQAELQTALRLEELLGDADRALTDLSA
jgi:sugar diacid utilization regulator